MMNNPYRARPGRPRTDHAAVANYNIQNKNMWPQMSGGTKPGEISQNIGSNIYQAPQSGPVTTQPKEAGDWSTESFDNGNDAWNWSIDQSQETQIQQHVPTYPNLGQTPQNLVHNNYYNNSNGNNKTILPPQPLLPSSGGNLSGAASRESTPHLPQSDSYSNYSNYSLQHQPAPISNSQPTSLNLPRLNANNTNQVQWGQSMNQQLPERQNSQPQSLPTMLTNFDVKNQNFPYKQQQQVQIQQQHQQQFETNKYNWDAPLEQSNKERWQNPVHPPNVYWQNYTGEHDSAKNSNNQWAQMTQKSDYSPAMKDLDEPVLQTQQWQENNPQKQSLETQNPPLQNIPFSEISQQPLNSNQGWPTGTVNNDMEKKLTEKVIGGNNIASPEWQQAEQPVRHFSPSQSPHSGISNQAYAMSQPPQVPKVEKLSAASFLPPPIVESSSPNIPANENRGNINISDLSSSINQMSLNESTHHQQFMDKPQLESLSQEIPQSHHRSVPASSYPPSVQQHLLEDVSRSTTSPQSDLTQALPKQQNNLTLAPPGEMASTQYRQEPVPPFNEYAVSHVRTMPSQEVNFPSNKSNSGINNPTIQGHNLPAVQHTDHANPSLPPESISQPTNYDQWYKQNAPQASQASQSNWYPNTDKIQSKLQQQWTPPPVSAISESLIDNCENIQPPAEFITPESTHHELSRNEAKSFDVDNKTAIHSTVAASHFQQHSGEQEQISSENYEFASNDRNTFLETGELTDSHQDQDSTAPSQDDDNDEVPGEIPFLREVPGQSSNADLPRNIPTGQEQYTIPAGVERRDVPPGQERRDSSTLNRDGPPRIDSDSLERRNDPSGRERSLPPVQPRNDPSGEERIPPQQISQSITAVDPNIVNIDSGARQIPGGVSPNESTMSTTKKPDDRNDRFVTGSQECNLSSIPQVMNTMQETREEAVGASTRDNTLITPGSPKRRDSYEDGDDEESGNSRDESRDRQRDRRDPRDSSPLADNRRRYDRSYYDHDRSREFDDDYYYDRRRPDYDRPYNSREDLEHRDAPFRDVDRRYRGEDPDDPNRRARIKGEEERDGKTGIKRDERRGQRDRSDDARRQDRDGRDYGYPRTPRDLRGRDYPDGDRRRRRFEDYDPREVRRDYYDDPYSRSSRPSSRSSYNDRERDYYMRTRDPYYGYNGYSGYEYGPNYNANYYAYLENLRRTNPTAYMEWYNKYYANQHLHHQQQQPQHQHQQPNSLPRVGSNYPEDRASVHSGQSSCDDRTPSGKNMMSDLSIMEDSKIMARMTPTKFSTSHVQGIFSIGSLIHVHASYPADGDRARVDIVGVDNLLLHDPIVRELRAYPGPLIKGVTHKKTIIEYCENKITKATCSERPNDRASYVLLYQLMIMLIQQNGNVVGVDIATLLLRNKETYPYEANETSKQKELLRRESNLSERSSGAGEDASAEETTLSPENQESGDKDQQLRKTVEQITTEFRNELLHGRVQKALDYAMKEGLWGHALFLASKLEKRTHASVMTRFANSLSVQDPLQTLYQLHSGRVPASVTCLSDSKWDDWRPHLAMIISNTSNNPEINRRSITIMGDTMAARGDIYAAHFCYILAEIDFGMYGKSGTKMVLIGSNHNKPYEEFVNLEAIMLTEIYEYARNLSEPGFMLAALQTFKFENAQTMIDYGLMEKALLYLEQIAVNIVNSPSNFNLSLISNVHKLSERIKFHDPVFKDSLEDEASVIWLNNLAEIVDKYKTGEIGQDVFHSHEILSDPQDMQQNQEQTELEPQIQQNQWPYPSNQPGYTEGGVSMMEVPTADITQDQWPTLSNQPSMQYVQNQDPNQYPIQSVPHQPQQDYWGQQPGYNPQEYNDWHHQPQSSQPQQYESERTDVDSTQQSNAWNYESKKEDKSPTPDPQPQISMGPSSGKQYDPLEELDALDQPKNITKSSETNKTVEKSSDKKAPNASGGSWFGGLFSKLAPKPKNQMILPDDNNPTIVWDPVGKKWMNKDEDSEGGSSSLAPPPKAANMTFKSSLVEPAMPPVPQPQVNQPNPSITEEATTPNSSKIIAGNNMFKLQKGRGMRANYIDVMNPNAVKGNVPAAPTPASSPMAPMAASSPQLFIPAPVNDPNAPVNFLTPTPAIIPSNETASQGLSRWSSTSSLSREVQSYTMRDPRAHQRTKGSMGYSRREESKESMLKNTPRTRNQLR